MAKSSRSKQPTSKEIKQRHKGQSVYISVHRNKLSIIVPETHDRWANEFFSSPAELKQFLDDNGVELWDRTKKPAKLNDPGRVYLSVYSGKLVLIDPNTQKIYDKATFDNAGEAKKYIQKKGLKLLDEEKSAD